MIEQYNLDVLSWASKTSKVKLDGVELKHAQKNPEAVKHAIAKALRIPPEEVDIDLFAETDDGIMVDVTHPADTNMHDNYVAKKLQRELQKKDGFENAEVGARNSS